MYEYVNVVVRRRRPSVRPSFKPSCVRRRRASSVRRPSSTVVVRCRPSSTVVVRRRPKKGKYVKYIGCESKLMTCWESCYFGAES